MRTLLGMIVGLVLAVAALLAWKTYSIATPYDDLWVGLNSRMPGPVRAWTCSTVEQRLLKTDQAKAQFKQPPKGCESLWGG